MTRGAGRRRRILFVQASGGGGSLINVLLLVKHLDHDRLKPIVLFYGPNVYEDEFREAGAEVRVLDSTVSVRSVAKILPASLRPPDEARSRFRSARYLNRFVQRDWPLARRIVDVIRDVEADLVQSNICPIADRASILAAGLAGVRQITYSQFFTAESRWLDGPLSTLVEEYLCISDAVRQQLLRATGIRADKARLVYAPFEFPSLDDERSSVALRDSLAVNGRHRLIANVGRIVPWKGQDVFLRAFASIAPDHPEARALVVGSAGDNQAGQAFEVDLRQLVSELGIEERVIFTGHRNDVEDLMHASDIVVHSSSKAEPLGRVIMEAIALQKPVIATGAGGVPEMVEDGETGSLVTPGDAASMARALDSVLTDAARAAKMARRGLLIARSRFDVRIFVQAMEGTYRRLIGF